MSAIVSFSEPALPIALKGQQLEAYNRLMAHLSPRLLTRKKFFVLEGGAGTGKTYLLSRINDAIGRFGAVYTGPTNKSTKVVSANVGGNATCKTIYSLLGIKMVADEDRLILEFPSRPTDLSGFARIFVDEASMINDELLAYIIKISEWFGTQWVFIGDRCQLPPVGQKESGVWALDCEKVYLSEVVRYDNEILKFATMVRRNVERFPKKSRLVFESDHSKLEGVWKYNRQLFASNIERAAKLGLFTKIDHTKAIAWRNKTVTELNDFIRFCIFGKQADKEAWIPGDRIMIGEPVHRHGSNTIIANIDDEGTILEVTSAYHSIYKELNCFNVSVEIDGGITVNLDILDRRSDAKFQRMLNVLANDAKRDRTKWKHFWMLKNSFHAVRYSYALTGHRSQGSTFTNVFLDTADIMANSNTFEALRCLYVGCTRATTKLILV